MDFYKLISTHRSIRRYKPDPVPGVVLDRILNASLRASSSGNMQTFSIIVTRNKVLKKKLYKLHFKQEMVLQAPLLLTFCSDFHRMRLWLRASKAPDNFDNFMSFLIGAIDAVLASQNAALASENDGLGICFLGTTLANCQKIAKILKLPKNVVPIVGFTVGYPDEEPELRDRLPLNGIVHYETYQNYQEKDIREIYKVREKKGFERYMSAPHLREKILFSQVNNLAQIYTKIKYTKASHVNYSFTVLTCLKEQNFFNQ